MFRFRELSLHGWDLWPPVRIPLDRDVVLVTGPNGSGKTTLLDAIRQLLNAPRLSSHRRLQNYLRRADQPALVKAVVSNDGAGGALFRRERITTPEVTLACALLPGGSGAPEKRFALLPGRPPAQELQALLLESRDWYRPERYQRALESAGVTRSLMSVLAIEQGRTNSLFELKPRELLRRVLEMLGDFAVLERYREARKRYDESEREVVRQTSSLQKLQLDLQRVEREVARLDAFEGAERRVAELEARLPAAELMVRLKGRGEAAAKLNELRTKVRNGEVERVRFEEEVARAREIVERGEAALEEARQAEKNAQQEWEVAHRRQVEVAAELTRLEGLEQQAAALPVADREALSEALETLSRAFFAAEREAERARSHQQAVARRVELLRQGAHVYPEPVTATLSALARQGIEPTLLAAAAEVAAPELGAAVEAALGDARFALLVDPAEEAQALAVARDQGFPGPVYAGPRLSEPLAVGSLRLDAGAPEWLRAWEAGVALLPDGSWRDLRGTWVQPAAERVLGEAGRQAALAQAEAELVAAAEASRLAELRRAEIESQRTETEERLSRERRRRQLVAEITRLPAVREEAGAAVATLESADERRRQAIAAREAAHARHDTAGRERAAVEVESRNHDARLRGEQEALARTTAEVADLDSEIASLSPRVSPELRLRAENRQLDGPDTVRSDLESARDHLAHLGEPPPAVREEAAHLKANLEEAEGYLRQRRDEAERAQVELAECRRRYLEVIQGALEDYRRRAEEIAAGAEVVVEMELPRLADDDRVLDEAVLLTRFGFDGKDPLPLGDPSFSGGQQVIAGLVLLMAMAETEGRGFFMLDEPFAHLSLDRVDQVGRFLRAAGAQFILTAPTTLDRAQLDPASLVIVLQKKRAKEPYAPVPIVAEA